MISQCMIKHEEDKSDLKEEVKSLKEVMKEITERVSSWEETSNVKN